MRRRPRYLATFALIVVVGLLVYGFKGGDFLSCSQFPRTGPVTCSGIASDTVMAIGAVLIVAGVLARR